MSVTFRVLPQPGSVGAQRNQILKKNQQIVELRDQVAQLRQQLTAFTAGAGTYGGYTPNYGTSPLCAPSYAQPASALSGWGALVGGLGSLFGGQPSYAPQKVGYAQPAWQGSSFASGYQNPFQFSPGCG